MSQNLTTVIGDPVNYTLKPEKECEPCVRLLRERYPGIFSSNLDINERLRKIEEALKGIVHSSCGYIGDRAFVEEARRVLNFLKTSLEYAQS